MPRRTKKDRFVRISKSVVFIAGAAIVLVALVVLFQSVISGWLEQRLVRFQPSISIDLTNLPLSEEATSSPTSAPLQRGLGGSFTELFSGMGWRNSERSTVYQDFKTLVISFPPDISWEPISGLSMPESLLDIAGNGEEVALLGANEIILVDNTFHATLYPLPEELVSGRVTYHPAQGRWMYAGTTRGGEVVVYEIAPDTIRLTVSTRHQGAVESLVCDSVCVLEVQNNLFQISSSQLSRIAIPADHAEVAATPIGDAVVVGWVEEDENATNIQAAIWKQGVLGTPTTLFTSSYTGDVAFHAGDDDILVAYSAYEGNLGTVEIQDNTVHLIEDYSLFFSHRVTENGFQPHIISDGAAWWVSGDHSRSLTRLMSDVGMQLTETIPLANIDRIWIAPGMMSNSVFVVVHDGTTLNTFVLHNNGFNMSTNELVWESLRVNAWDGYITEGSFRRIEGETGGGSIMYSLSNNGGKTWERPNANGRVIFENRAGDFRWRAVLSAGSDKNHVPWLGIVGLEYRIVRE